MDPNISCTDLFKSNGNHLPFFFGPLQITASFFELRKNAIDTTLSFFSESTITGIHLLPFTKKLAKTHLNTSKVNKYICANDLL
jgi:hypothetical protein